MRETLLLTLVAAAITWPAGSPLCEPSAEELTEVVVTATRLQTPVDEVSGTILVVSSEEIRQKQAGTVSEALVGLPGVDLVSQGGIGKTSSILLRGGDTRFTLVMIDGIEVNDPSNPERTFDFAHLPTADIERIEVLFGPQSTLYGSDAIGGVINIITRKGTGPSSLLLELETGSFETGREYAAYRGRSGKTSWSLAAQHLDSGGISAASERDGNNERDAYENLSVSGNLQFDLGSTGSLRLDARSIGAENELDYSGGPGGDDPNFSGTADQLLLGLQFTFFPAEIWELRAGMSKNSHKRHDLNEPDPDRPFTMELDYRGNSEKAEVVNNFYVSDHHTLTLGLDTERETGESTFFSDEFGSYTSSVPEEKARISGTFVHEQYTSGSGTSFSLGGRVDDHSDFGRETTWRGGLSIPVSTRMRLRAVYGTGFRAPSIDQLFNPDYGNPDLGAEKSRGWDAGLEMALGGKATFSAAWFLTRYDNLIAWFDADGDPNTWWDGSYDNISTAEAKGVDLAVDARLGKVSARINGSWLRTEDDQGEELLRRPAVRWGTRIGYDPSERLNLMADAVFVGERKDWGGVIMDDYFVLNLAGGWRASDIFEVHGRIQNVTDEQYEEAGGYGTPGRAAYVGIRARL